MNTEPTTRLPASPPSSSSDLLADAYRQAAEMRNRLLDAVWSRGMTRNDHKQVAHLQTRMLKLENTVY